MNKKPEMTGEEIGKELGITRQAVCNSLKRSLGKIYSRLREDNPDISPFEIVSEMMKYFDISGNQNDIQNFYNLFPPKIRKEIENSLRNYGYSTDENSTEELNDFLTFGSLEDSCEV